PTTPLERLLFAQGGNCFFCDQPLARDQASVEHLVAQANGGSNNDGNCVACCKAINRLLGSMSLKEKIRVVLNQRVPFRCPNAPSSPEVSQTQSPSSPQSKSTYEVALAYLRKQGTARPRKPKALRNTMAALFPGTELAMIESVVEELKAAGKLSEVEGKVTYTL
ncbi:MAG: HNH endonuclease, partial [Isosphaeraceae bacterium]